MHVREAWKFLHPQIDRQHEGRSGAPAKPAGHRIHPRRPSRSQIVGRSRSTLITVSEGQFFSNGFNLRYAQAVCEKVGSAKATLRKLGRMVDLFRGVVDLLSLPIIAYLTDHATATRLLLAMSHDYIVMTKLRAVMYMSELDLGMTLLDCFRALIREKIGWC